MISPEFRTELASDPQVIKLQFYFGDFFGEVTPHIVCSNKKPRDPMSDALRYDDHRSPPLLPHFYARERV